MLPLIMLLLPHYSMLHSSHACRVSIGMELVTDPGILLLDEP
jgi:ABC-type molybdate transport system ATPase subunit